MTDDKEPLLRGIEHRFRDLSADVREERLVRYIVHQLETGRHVEDIVNDAHVVEHFDEAARKRILEHPDVIKGVGARLRRQFAGYGDSVGKPKPTMANEDSAGRANDDRLPDL